jgi:hypothetical protein
LRVNHANRGPPITLCVQRDPAARATSNWILMPLIKNKDVKIGEHTYRIGLIPADIGNWCATQMLSGKSATFDTFRAIQGYLLAHCQVLMAEGGGGEPVAVKIYADGKWLVPKLELEYDLDTVSELTREAMSFNFDGFFEKLEARGLITRPTPATK